MKSTILFLVIMMVACIGCTKSKATALRTCSECRCVEGCSCGCSEENGCMCKDGCKCEENR